MRILQGFILPIVLVLAISLVNCASNTTEKTSKTTVVYSYSNVTATDEGTTVNQLTIATGPDGKYHFVKKENGTTTEGIWEGPLPSTPSVDSMVSDITKGAIDPELKNLSSGIHSSIQDYLMKAFQ